MDEDLARAAVREWLGDDATISPLQAMNSSTWAVQAGDERYVLKIASPTDAPGLEAAAWLDEQGFRSGGPVRTTIRDGRLAALLRYVEGRELGWDEVDAIGRTLGRVHGLLADAPVPAAIDRWPWQWLDAGAIREPELRAAAERAIARANELAPDMTHGILHGDPAPEAFVELDGDVGLIDWGAAVHGPLLYDVASARMYAHERIVDAYAAVGPLDGAELAHVPDFLAFRWALQAWYFSGRLARGDLTGIEDQADNEEGLDHARRSLLG